MKEEIREVLGVQLGEESTPFKVPMLVYATVDEGDKAGGREGAVLAEANNNLLYRGTYADARELIMDCAREVTNIPFKMKDTGEKDEKGQPVLEVDESEKDYVRRVITTPELFNKVQNLVTQRARGYKTPTGVEVPALAADISQRERKPRKPAKLSDKMRQIATEFLTGARAKFLPKFLKDATAALGRGWDKTGDAAKDVESLGWYCQAYDKYVKEQASSKAFGA